MSTPLTMSINTISIAQVRNAGLVLSTGSDFRTIVARNFSQGRKVFVAIWYHFVAPVILTIVARNFTHGRKVLDFVAPILSNNTYNCCLEHYSWQKGLCCSNNNDNCCLIVRWNNALVRFGRYHSTFPPVSGFRELWHSKTRFRFYHGCHNNFSPPIILTWFSSELSSLGAIKHVNLNLNYGDIFFEWFITSSTSRFRFYHGCHINF